MKIHTYRVYPNRGGAWRAKPWQRGHGIQGGLWKSRPYHRGHGIGSFIAKMTKKFIPLAGKFAKKSVNAIKNSDTLKEVGKTILDTGVNALVDVAANSLDPADNNNTVAENAQLRLDEARKDIANILRSKKRTKHDDSDSDSDDSLDNVTVVKRSKKGSKNKKRQKYNMLKKVRNGK